MLQVALRRGLETKQAVVGALKGPAQRENVLARARCGTGSPSAVNRTGKRPVGVKSPSPLLQPHFTCCSSRAHPVYIDIASRLFDGLWLR